MIERGKGNDSNYLLGRPGGPTAWRRHRLDGGGVMTTTDKMSKLENLVHGLTIAHVIYLGAAAGAVAGLLISAIRAVMRV